MRKRKLLGILVLISILFLSIPNFFYKNSGSSVAHGSPGTGSLDNAYQLPYSFGNASYFSPISYYLLDDAFVHSKVYNTVVDSYATCKATCPDTHFKIMECSRKRGGNMLLHRTHENGLSIDFMMPLKKKNGKQRKRYDYMGLWHYLLKFDSDGQLSFDAKTEIDFETMAKHILALDDAARENGLRIKKVILKINLKDDFFQTKSGQAVKRRGIYFAKSLPKVVDNMHDDHYHVDFVVQ